jgi:hypothetical protein
MRGNSAQLPVDFLIGFTIFILCLIAVANFVPSLLVGLQRTSGIDYDAVAYRTGVVLAEDPGWPAGNPVMGEFFPGDSMPWEQGANDTVIRLGLTLTADSPNILSINKINKLFNSTIFPGNDYRTKILFSDYQYGYNITLQSIFPLRLNEPLLNMTIGDPHPAGYGYIRRYVYIKQNTNVTINLNTTCKPNTLCQPGADELAYTALNETQAQDSQEFRIRLDGRLLYNQSIANPYKIDLLKEPFTIRITNLSNVLNNSKLNPSPVAGNTSAWMETSVATGCFPLEQSPPTSANLSSIIFYPDCKPPDIPFYANRIVLTVDDNQNWNALRQESPPAIMKVPVYDTIQLDIDPLWPPGTPLFDSLHCLEIGLVFDPGDCTGVPHTLISGSFVYDYFNVTRPDLVPGMLEVSIW